MMRVIKMQQLQEDEAPEPEDLEALYRELLAVFQERNDIDHLPLSFREAALLIGEVYGDAPDPTPETPTQPASSGTQSSSNRTQPARRKKSLSSGS